MSENQIVDNQTPEAQSPAPKSQWTELFHNGKNSLSEWFAASPLNRFRQTKLASLGQKFSDLTVSQWMYLFAGIILFLSTDEDVEADSSLIWVGAIAGIGLMRELWHVFNRIWENMLGRGLILVLYAATANFAVAIAALKVNAITGIEPGPFIFTIGFTTLLMLPFWLLVSSIILFSVAIFVNGLWLIFSVLLRIIRIKVKVHWEDRSFVFATMLLRVILIPYVVMSLFYVAVPFAEQIEILDNPISLARAAIKEQEQAENSPSAPTEPQNVTVTVDPDMAKILTADERLGSGVYDQLVAHFIYHFETYPNSACKKTVQQRSLPIDENLILLVEENDSELGYHFFVGPCEGNFSSPVSE